MAKKPTTAQSFYKPPMRRLPAAFKFAMTVRRTMEKKRPEQSSATSRRE